MIRALAEFIMRGRWQAATAAMLGSWFLTLAPTVVALVALRRGALDGFVIMLWAMLPPLVGLWLNIESDVAVYLVAAVLLTTVTTALVLKASVSWSQALVALPVSAVMWSGVAVVMAQGSGSELVKALLGSLTAEQIDELLPGVHNWGALTITGWFAYLVASSSLISVLFGRWLQALLYNPGGFQTEMHHLRMPPAIALACAGAAVWSLTYSSGSMFWAGVFGLPLVVAGIGLVHHMVKAYGLGLVTLVVFYVALIVVRAVLFGVAVRPVLLGVAVLAFVDTFINIRSRFKSTQ